MAYKLVIGAAAALTGLLAIKHLAKEDEETESVKSNESVLEPEDDLSDDVFYFDEESQSYHPVVDNGLRRGDRFICPDTGEELQIRAVGGRPRKS